MVADMADHVIEKVEEFTVVSDVDSHSQCQMRVQIIGLSP